MMYLRTDSTFEPAPLPGVLLKIEEFRQWVITFHDETLEAVAYGLNLLEPRNCPHTKLFVNPKLVNRVTA
jgi:hypothetical protein